MTKEKRNLSEVVYEIRDNADNRDKMAKLYGELIRGLFNNYPEFQDFMGQFPHNPWTSVLYSTKRESSYFEDLLSFFFEEDVVTIDGVDFEFMCGATKGVFYISDVEGGLPYVVKFPNVAYVTNYCALEEEVYANAEAEGFACLFAETFGIGAVLQEINENFNLLFYLQETCDVDSDITQSEAIHEVMTSNDFYESDWETAYISVDGVGGHDYTIVKALIDSSIDFEYFLYRNDVTDLHSGNFGKAERFGEEAYVLIDFSGY